MTGISPSAFNSANIETFGPRTAYSQANLANGTTFKQIATTDGFVLATVGQPTATENYVGTLEGFTTDSSGNTTSFAYATGVAYHYTAPNGKKGSTSVLIPVPGSFTLPVRKGETWNLQLTWVAAVGPAPTVEFYWVPDDAQQGQAEQSRTRSPMRNGMQALRNDIQSGQMQQRMQASAQQAINERVDDLTRILGDATNMSSNQQDRAQFVKDLQKIVCSAAPQGQQPNNQVNDHDVQELIGTFARVTGRQFAQQENGLLDAGIRALVQINDNDANRHNLGLIQKNVGLFIDNVQQALKIQFDNNDRRLLTRALVRIVGDGTQQANS